MTRLFALIGLAGLLLGIPALAWSESITLYPTRDNTLYEYATGDTSNGAGPVFFAGMNSQGRARRALLRFDVASGLPSGAVVTGVELLLTITDAPHDSSVSMTLHRVSSDWGEGTSSSNSGRGAPATTSDATWTYAFYPTVMWAQAGGDFGPVLASADVSSSGSASWSGEDLVTDVKAWVSNPETNFGWLLKGDESTPGTARGFASREASDASQRPKLIIQYTSADQLRVSTWGEQKSHWAGDRR
jgi:hypothetical protein